MKEIFIKNNIPTAKCIVLKEEVDKKTILEQISYPIVVKPCDCNSSKGVVKVNNDEELKNAIEQAFQLSRSNLVIIEKFLDGREVSIDAWIDKEGAKILSISETEKIQNGQDSFTIYKSKYPVKITKTVKDKVQKVAQMISESFELYNCPLLIQAIVDENDVHVIEFSARMGGGTKYKLIEYMTSVNIMKAYVNRVLGDEQQIINPIPTEGCIELNYVYAKKGTFSKLVNFEELMLAGEIADYYQYKENGAVIEKATTSSDRIAGFLILSDNEEQMEQKRKSVVEKVDVLNEVGESMMLKEIYGGNGVEK